MWYWIYQFLKLFALLALPFILLIRGAVYFHIHQAWSPWVALLGGALGAALLLVLYLTFIHGKLTGRVVGGGVLKRRALLAGFLVLGYCIHGVVFLSSNNAKGEQVQREFTRLHPILRLGVSTLIFLDPALLITDASRQPEDYRKMGLPTKTRSLHYPQSNGYVHAIDLRTRGHGEWRNALLKGYFRLMGFRTLRHGGTADHLHVSLFSRDAPGAL
ncbi:MAG: hypothetical protein AAFW73_22080 [Bacteroidota bacterium]